MFSDDELNRWFRQKVLILEPLLTAFMRRIVLYQIQMVDAWLAAVKRFREKNAASSRFGD